MQNYTCNNLEDTLKKIPEIKPCRFCGFIKSKIRHVENRNEGRSGTMYAVQCLHCYARGPIVKDLDDQNPDVAKAEAVRKWNEVSE